MSALRELKLLFELHMFALYHTTAFAYVRGRSTIDAIKRHQRNESKWFLKLDFSNFFGSTTPEFVLDMLSRIFPFSEIVRVQAGKDELAKVLSLCFLNNGLPQGTPISPFLTNVMMIAIDHKISNTLRNFDNRRFVYTRYADDLLISCQIRFDKDKVQRFVMDALTEYNAPFTIKPEKTRYGSSSGRNWTLGVMLNEVKPEVETLGDTRKSYPDPAGPVRICSLPNSSRQLWEPGDTCSSGFQPGVSTIRPLPSIGLFHLRIMEYCKKLCGWGDVSPTAELFLKASDYQMADFNSMYKKLFNVVTDAIEILQAAQVETEEMFIDHEPADIRLIIPEDDEDGSHA
jgi:hypothetical protein